MADKMNTDYWNKFYGGGMNPSIPFVPEPGSLGYASSVPNVVAPPSITPAQRAAMQAIPGGSYQWPKAIPIDNPAAPAGYSYPDTGNAGRATGAMTQQLGIPGAVGVTPASWGPFEQAYANAANKPGTWLATSRMNAQALMRQMAALRGGMPMAPGAVPAAPAAAPGRSGGLAALITGTGTPRASTPSLVSLLGGGTPAPVKTGPTGVGTNGYTYVNGQNIGYAPAELAKREAQGKAIAAANKKNPNPTKTVTGDNNAFMPKSVQESVRWQTGY